MNVQLLNYVVKNSFYNDFTVDRQLFCSAKSTYVFKDERAIAAIHGGLSSLLVFLKYLPDGLLHNEPSGYFLFVIQPRSFLDAWPMALS